MKRLIFLALITTCLNAADAFAAGSPTPPIFQLRLVLDTPSADSEPMTFVTKSKSNADTTPLNVQKTALLDQTGLKSAKPGHDVANLPAIDLEFNAAGARRFEDATRQNTHKRLAIIINGQLYSAPIIQTAITGGNLQISGPFTEQEAMDLAAKINAALPKE